MPRLNSYRELEHLREHLREQRQSITTTVMVCGGTGCQASNSQAVIDAVRDELSKQGLEQNVRLCVTGCPQSDRKTRNNKHAGDPRIRHRTG